MAGRGFLEIPLTTNLPFDYKWGVEESVAVEG